MLAQGRCSKTAAKDQIRTEEQEVDGLAQHAPHPMSPQSTLEVHLVLPAIAFELLESVLTAKRFVTVDYRGPFRTTFKGAVELSRWLLLHH